MSEVSDSALSAQSDATAQPLAQKPQRFGFDVALQLLRQGEAVRRASWGRPGLRLTLPSDRAIMASAPIERRPWRWTIDHASILATDWELATHD